MMKVYAGMGAWGIPDVSPPCLKLRTYLKMAKLPFEDRPGDPRKGPTKKVPYIQDDDGAFLGDSGFIIEHLKKKHGDPLDGRLSKSERATGHLIRRTVEESLYWATLYPRWCTDEGAAEMGRVFAPLMPKVIGGLVFGAIKGQTRKSAFAQGIARHKPENSYAIGKADLDALSVTLGDGAYLFGDEPTSYDACLYGTVANILAFPVKNPLTDHARTLENLVAFRGRVEARYWKEPAATTTKRAPSAQPAAPA
jgi:glutathione S-transferase